MRLDEERINVILAARLRKARTDAGFTQDKAAREAGLHRTAVGLIETAVRQPRIDTLLKLAGVYGVTASELLEGLDG